MGLGKSASGMSKKSGLCKKEIRNCTGSREAMLFEHLPSTSWSEEYPRSDWSEEWLIRGVAVYTCPGSLPSCRLQNTETAQRINVLWLPSLVITHPKSLVSNPLKMCLVSDNKYSSIASRYRSDLSNTFRSNIVEPLIQTSGFINKGTFADWRLKTPTCMESPSNSASGIVIGWSHEVYAIDIILKPLQKEQWSRDIFFGSIKDSRLPIPRNSYYLFPLSQVHFLNTWYRRRWLQFPRLFNTLLRFKATLVPLSHGTRTICPC